MRKSNWIIFPLIFLATKQQQTSLKPTGEHSLGVLCDSLKPDIRPAKQYQSPGLEWLLDPQFSPSPENTNPHEIILFWGGKWHDNGLTMSFTWGKPIYFNHLHGLQKWIVLGCLQRTKNTWKNWATFPCFWIYLIPFLLKPKTYPFSLVNFWRGTKFRRTWNISFQSQKPSPIRDLIIWFDQYLDVLLEVGRRFVNGL